jgi:tetratricopeptide (TPR) repeat protein
MVLDREPMAPVAAPEAMAQVEAILSSPRFAAAPRLSRLLRYIVEKSLANNPAALKEYQVGVDVFDRRVGYETSTDPVVRVEVRQLRFKLADYYAGPGMVDEIVISIPKGGYVAQFERRVAESPEAVRTAESLPPRPEAAKQSSRWPRFRWVAVAVVIALAALGFPSFRAKLPWAASGKSYRANPEAETLYLTGRYYWNKRTPEDLNRALDYFTQAIVRDPQHARAYAGLADTYNLLGEYTGLPRRDAFARSMAAAKRALALDDSLAEAHCSLAFVTFYGALDFSTADREFRRAIELDPRYVAAHHWRATALMSAGHIPEALAEIERAQQLEPGSRSILADKGFILWYAGKRQQSMDLLRQMVASEPSFVSPHRYLSVEYLVARDYPNYLVEARQTALLSHNDSAVEVVREAEAGFQAGAGPGMLERMIDAENRLLSRGGSYYEIAQTYALAGKKDEALKLLRSAIERREMLIVGIGIDQQFDSLRSDPAFRDLVARVGRAQ